VALAARHAGRVSEDGLLHFRNIPAWRAAILRNKGRDIWVELHRVSAKASHDQHGYYRACILPLLAEEWGWGDPGELHRELKLLHLPKVIPVEEWPRRRIGRNEIVDVPSCADMSIDQFRQFLQAVLDQAADAGVIVPPPRGVEGG
jgi:hypothetical protein